MTMEDYNCYKDDHAVLRNTDNGTGYISDWVPVAVLTPWACGNLLLPIYFHHVLYTYLTNRSCCCSLQ